MYIWLYMYTLLATNAGPERYTGGGAVESGFCPWPSTLWAARTRAAKAMPQSGLSTILNQELVGNRATSEWNQNASGKYLGWFQGDHLAAFFYMIRLVHLPHFFGIRSALKNHSAPGVVGTSVAIPTLGIFNGSKPTYHHVVPRRIIPPIQLGHFMWLP